MLIKITTPYCLRAGFDVAAGEVIEATAQEAQYAFATGRAVRVAADAAGNQAEQPASEKPAKAWGRRK